MSKIAQLNVCLRFERIFILKANFLKMIEYANNYSSINDSEYEESIDETIECAMKENQVVKVKKKHEYSEQDLVNAIDKVKNRTATCFAVLREYKIPCATIQNRLSGRSKIKKF